MPSDWCSPWRDSPKIGPGRPKRDRAKQRTNRRRARAARR